MMRQAVWESIQEMQRPHAQILVSCKGVSEGMNLGGLTDIVFCDGFGTRDEFVARSYRTGRAGHRGRIHVISSSKEAALNVENLWTNNIGGESEANVEKIAFDLSTNPSFEDAAEAQNRRDATHKDAHNVNIGGKQKHRGGSTRHRSRGSRSTDKKEKQHLMKQNWRQPQETSANSDLPTVPDPAIALDATRDDVHANPRAESAPAKVTAKAQPNSGQGNGQTKYQNPVTTETKKDSTEHSQRTEKAAMKLNSQPEVRKRAAVQAWEELLRDRDPFMSWDSDWELVLRQASVGRAVKKSKEPVRPDSVDSDGDKIPVED
ncbi:hypothetical protein PV04_00075 [Phialophora macrospora]|uniref:Helicase C-terminal domain-containing protein n=1 Tax=Phialophora macrospora TaxID=1851006 RepID=A0A0D2FTR5_9EURO|nr:hypothetical protein PV04_00075 [Phialophora macrospora]